MSRLFVVFFITLGNHVGRVGGAAARWILWSNVTGTGTGTRSFPFSYFEVKLHTHYMIIA